MSVEIERHIIGKLAPKKLDTLRECMRPLIGREFTFEFAGTSCADEPYPGQRRWVIDRKHDAEIPDECIGYWMPEEDIEK